MSQRPIKESLVDPIDEVALQRMWSGVAERRRERDRWLPRLALAGVLLVIAAWAIARTMPAPTSPQPQLAASTPASLASSIAPKPGARLEVIRDDAEGVELVLERGMIALHIETSPRWWRVDVGSMIVEVQGAWFEVERAPERVSISVTRGAVRLIAAPFEDGMRVVRAGETASFELAPEQAITAAPLPPGQAERAASAASGEAGRRIHSADNPPWLEARPIARVAIDDPLDQLLASADRARLAGDFARAAALLETAMRVHGDALAAFSLGKIELEQLNRPKRAAQAFDRALELGLPEALREDARARKAEALAKE